MKELTQKRLKELLHYDPETGLFKNCKSRGAAKKWCVAGSMHNGYLRITIYGKRYMAHRLAYLYMTGDMPVNECDHINHIRDDNRWCNLRDVERVDNARNASISISNKSGCKGVFYEKERCLWVAAIGNNGKQVKLGRFKDIDDAVRKRKSSEVELGYHKNHGVNYD